MVISAPKCDVINLLICVARDVTSVNSWRGAPAIYPFWYYRFLLNFTKLQWHFEFKISKIPGTHPPNNGPRETYQLRMRPPEISRRPLNFKLLRVPDLESYTTRDIVNMGELTGPGTRKKGSDWVEECAQIPPFLHSARSRISSNDFPQILVWLYGPEQSGSLCNVELRRWVPSFSLK